MGFKCGIVGLPNVGKSTLFNALTKAGIAAENYPFCTIEPNTGIVPVPDPRLNALAKIVHPERIVPTTMEFVDIAGLVAGASKGEGLGNQFLAAIRETDAIAHVVRCFDDDNVTHVSNRVNPVDDIKIINMELSLADLDTVEKNLARIAKQAKGGDKEASELKGLLERLIPILSEGERADQLELSATEQALLHPLCLLSLKPVVYIANIPEKELRYNEHLDAVQHYAALEGSFVIAVCNKIESELAELDEAERLIFLQELKLKEPGLNRVIRAGYKLLGLQTYFTAGVKEVRAWTISRNTSAPKAAAVIHTDFEKGFIRAEVIAYNAFIHFNGEQGAKEAGKWRLEGKEYIVQDGDVMHFRVAPT